MPSEETARAWVRILRDVFCVAVGAFMLVWETTNVANPNPYVIGGGLTALGLPAVIRLDLRGRND